MTVLTYNIVFLHTNKSKNWIYDNMGHAFTGLVSHRIPTLPFKTNYKVWKHPVSTASGRQPPYLAAIIHWLLVVRLTWT